MALGGARGAGDRHARPHARPHRLLLRRRRGAACGDTLFSLGCGRLIEGTRGRDVCLAAASSRRCRAPRWCAAATNTPRATPASRSPSILPTRRCRRARPRRGQQRAAGQPTVPSRLGERAGRPTRSCAPPTLPPSPACAPERTALPLKLIGTPTSPYVRKVAGLRDHARHRRADRAGPANPHVSPASLLAVQPALEGAVPGDRR